MEQRLCLRGAGVAHSLGKGEAVSSNLIEGNLSLQQRGFLLIFAKITLIVFRKILQTKKKAPELKPSQIKGKNQLNCKLTIKYSIIYLI